MSSLTCGIFIFSKQYIPLNTSQELNCSQHLSTQYIIKLWLGNTFHTIFSPTRVSYSLSMYFIGISLVKEIWATNQRHLLTSPITHWLSITFFYIFLPTCSVVVVVVVAVIVVSTFVFCVVYSFAIRFPPCNPHIPQQQYVCIPAQTVPAISCNTHPRAVQRYITGENGRSEAEMRGLVAAGKEKEERERICWLWRHRLLGK